MRVFKWILIGALIGVFSLPYVLFRQNEMPSGTNLQSPEFFFSEGRLLFDRTSWDPIRLRSVRSQRIFDTILDEIETAQTFIIADFFLWNPWRGKAENLSDLRPIAKELADALIQKRIQNPDIPILVITDPINRIYGDLESEYYQRLEAVGISVVFTDLKKIPDSNRLYAPQAKFWGQYLSGVFPSRWVPNPFDSRGEKLTFEQFGRMLFFKANHRKVLVTGYRQAAPRLLVGSFNPADSSANHSNVAALVDGAVAIYAAHSELSVAQWSLDDLVSSQQRVITQRIISQIRQLIPTAESLPQARAGMPTVSWRSEGTIKSELLDQINQTNSGSRLDAAVFYFSDRHIVAAFKKAIRRGVKVRLLLDANHDAFGREKNGIPNRAVAAELMALVSEGDITVRWAATNGEQFHAKVLRIEGKEQNVLFLGSANWTRRNLANLNLEANLLFQNTTEIVAEFDRYFDILWSNSRGYNESLPYAHWAETGFTLHWKGLLYRFQEWSGASTF